MATSFRSIHLHAVSPISRPLSASSIQQHCLRASSPWSLSIVNDSPGTTGRCQFLSHVDVKRSHLSGNALGDQCPLWSKPEIYLCHGRAWSDPEIGHQAFTSTRTSPLP